MVKHRIKIISKAEKDMNSIPCRDFDVLKKKIVALSENPRPFGCQKLTNEEGYRIRAGDFRILYRINDTSKEIIIYRIKHRREVYR
jgi:mRNA interferase RelE/StbE